MTRQLAGPAGLALAALVARRYYLDDRSKVEIAGELGLSRFKIARLLETARDSGLVRIEIGHPGLIDVGRAAQIMDRFGLRHAVVVDTPEDHAELLRRQLGQVASSAVANVTGVPVAAIARDALVWGVSDARTIGQVTSPTVADVAGGPVARIGRDAGIRRGRRHRGSRACRRDSDDCYRQSQGGRDAGDHDDLRIHRLSGRRTWGRLYGSW